MNETSLMPQIAIQTTYSKVFLSLGELFVAEQPTHVWTVLGSCVSVVLYNPRKKISALCHAQLSEDSVFGAKSGNAMSEQYSLRAIKNDFRYVRCSINYMLEQMLVLGVHKNEIQASIYGGANMIELFTHKIGDKNFKAACNVLEENGIKIIKNDVGGNKSRTIRHFSDTGVTLVRSL